MDSEGSDRQGTTLKVPQPQPPLDPSSQPSDYEGVDPTLFRGLLPDPVGPDRRDLTGLLEVKEEADSTP